MCTGYLGPAGSVRAIRVSYASPPLKRVLHAEEGGDDALVETIICTLPGSPNNEYDDTLVDVGHRETRSSPDQVHDAQSGAFESQP